PVASSGACRWVSSNTVVAPGSGHLTRRLGHSSLGICGDHPAAAQRAVVPSLRAAPAAGAWPTRNPTWPRHIAVLCDGNRRWARSAGYDDVSYGYRMGAAKIAEMNTVVGPVADI
ncbi:conserved hypothetical protein, partial [Mycobacterium tuberculosis variant africanum K85]